uniref:Uncharacterized protein n=1 Tax=Ignisphaera aggregans TaxID=334771 RepID=A0A7J2U531_9CREN
MPMDAARLLDELRKSIPLEKLREALAPEIRKSMIFSPALYGIPIIVYGEGFLGQFLRHAYMQVMGVRYWLIEFGITTLYGELKNGSYVPLLVLRMPTTYVFEYKPDDFERFFVVEDTKGYIDVLERQIINLDRVMQVKDPVMVIDRYDLLKDRTPDEFMEKVKEQQELIMRMQRALWEYEKNVGDYRANVVMLQARVSKLQEQLMWYQERLTKAVVELQSMQQELVRLRDEVFVRGVEAEALERGRRRLVDIVDRLGHVAEILTTWREEIAELETAKTPKPEEKEAKSK